MELSERFYLADSMRQVASELDGASERAIALVCGAIVDEGLSRIIQLRLIEDPKILKEVFEGQGGLATFSSKIAMGRLMNFYSSDTFSDLNIIRKIRNDAAHATHSFAFNEGANKSRALSLKIPDKHLFELGTNGAENVAGLFVENVTEVRTNPLLRYVGTTIFLAWNFTAWADLKPDHLRPQGPKSCPI